MRVLHLTASGALGGAERCLLDMVAPTGATVPQVEQHLLAPTPGPLLERARALGVRATILPMHEALLRLGDAATERSNIWSSAAARARAAVAAVPAAGRYVAALRAAIERLRPTIVHTHGIKLHVLASAAARGRVPMVWHLHDFLSHRSAIAPLFRVVPRPAVAVAVSAAVAADARSLLPDLPVTVVHNGVDTTAFQPRTSNGDWLDELGGLASVAPDVPRIGLVATYAWWKGHGVFLDSIARLVRAGSDRGARFYIVGGPIYDTQGSQFSETDLRARAQGLGLGARVGFVPFQMDPAKVYGALDVVVHASTRPEPFGLTIAEAMSCGRPVVLARTAGAAEVVHEGHDALVVASGDSSALAAALTELLADPERRRAVGCLARQRAVKDFSRERMANGVRSAYGQAVASGVRRAKEGDS